jgi:hypothetical protein
MPNYVPCRTEQDGEAHLHAAGEPDRALCGKPVDSGSPSEGGLPVCHDCAKRLLARILHHSGPGRITSVEVTVHS